MVSEAAEQTALQSFAEMGWERLPSTGWTNATLPSARFRLALAHPGFGVALLNFAPANPPDALATLQRRLEVVGFSNAFPGTLPIVQGCLTVEDVWRLPTVLDPLFAALPPIELKGREWIERIRQALVLEPGFHQESVVGVPEHAGEPPALEGMPSTHAGPDAVLAGEASAVPLVVPAPIGLVITAPSVALPDPVATEIEASSVFHASVPLPLVPTEILSLPETTRILSDTSPPPASFKRGWVMGRVMIGGFVVLGLGLGALYLDRRSGSYVWDRVVSLMFKGEPDMQLPSLPSPLADATSVSGVPPAAIGAARSDDAGGIVLSSQILAASLAMLQLPRPDLPGTPHMTDPLPGWALQAAEFPVALVARATPNAIPDVSAPPPPFMRPNIESDASPPATALALPATIIHSEAQTVASVPTVARLTEPDPAPDVQPPITALGAGVGRGEPQPAMPRLTPAAPDPRPYPPPPANVVAAPPEPPGQTETPPLQPSIVASSEIEAVTPQTQPPNIANTAVADTPLTPTAPDLRSVTLPPADIPVAPPEAIQTDASPPPTSATLPSLASEAVVAHEEEPPLRTSGPEAVPETIVPPAIGAAQTAAQLPPTNTSVPTLEPRVIEIIMARGNEMLARGDISAARLLFSRAAAAGSAAAAIAMARTFDPAVLNALGARGIRPDAAQAAHWQRRAAELAGAP